jgi:hypothetical protein
MSLYFGLEDFIINIIIIIRKSLRGLRRQEAVARSV